MTIKIHTTKTRKDKDLDVILMTKYRQNSAYKANFPQSNFICILRMMSRKYPFREQTCTHMPDKIFHRYQTWEINQTKSGLYGSKYQLRRIKHIKKINIVHYWIWTISNISIFQIKTHPLEYTYSPSTCNKKYTSCPSCKACNNQAKKVHQN